MKNKRKILLTSGIVMAIVGIVASVMLILQLLPVSNLSAFAETVSSSQEKSETRSSSETSDSSTGLYANGAVFTAEKNADKKAPVITEKDVTVEQGTKVNVMENVSAKDDVDGDLTKEIVNIGDVNTAKTGTYTVQLAVTDDSGNTATAAKKITVKAKEVKQQTTAASSSNSETESSTASSSAAESSSSESATASNSGTASSQEQSQPAPQKAATTYSAMTMYLAGTAVAYQNGGTGSGQSIIDGNPYGVVSTWGGAAYQSGSDGMNSHFIGHNPGIFANLFSLGSGSQIVVTDASGNPTVYTATTFLKVNDSGVGSDGKNYWSLITGTGGGERITLQTCIDDSTNYIVIAYA